MREAARRGRKPRRKNGAHGLPQYPHRSVVIATSSGGDTTFAAHAAAGNETCSAGAAEP